MTSSSWDGRIPGTPLVVDNFRPRRTATMAAAGESHHDGHTETFYFCTHAHTDHTGGLSSTWDLGRIYCSHLTKQLLLHQFGPSLERRIIGLDEDQEHTIMTGRVAPDPHQDRLVVEDDDDGGDEYGVGPPAARRRRITVAPSSSRADSFSVTLFPSNHCPGSVMFAFSSSQWGRILHTGDFRYDPAKFHSAALHALIGQIDVLYFDATFMNTECAFPKKYEAIREIANAIRSMQEKHAREFPSAAGGASAPSPPPCPAAFDWRVYLCSDTLGGEELLASISHEFGESFIAPRTVDMEKRVTQLEAIARYTGEQTHVAFMPPTATNPPGAGGRSVHPGTRPPSNSHLYLAHGGGFQRFAQRNRIERANEKTKVRIEQEMQLALRHGSAIQSYSLTPAHSPGGVGVAAGVTRTSPPLTLYVNPSTLWFVNRTRSAASGSLTHAGILPLGSSFLSRGGMVRSRAEEELDQFAHAANSAPNKMPTRADDRWGVTHILWSMHSDCAETIDFLKFMRPRVAIPINVPVLCRADALEERYAGSPGHAPAPIHAVLGPASAPLIRHVEQVLRQAMPVEEVPIVKSVEYTPTVRQNALARQQRDMMLMQVNKMKEWNRMQHARALNGDSSSVGDSASDVGSNSTPPMRRAYSSPVKGKHARDGGGVTARDDAFTPCDKRIKLSHPPSPLDTLGGGFMHSRWRWTNNTHTAATGSVAPSFFKHSYPSRTDCKIPFNPRKCSDLHIHIERDIRPDLRQRIAHRLRHIGCQVSEWSPPHATTPAATPTAASGTTWTPCIMPFTETPESAASKVGNGTPAVSSPAQPSKKNTPAVDIGAALPIGVTVILISLDRPSTSKLLLPFIIKQVEEMIRNNDQPNKEKTAKQTSVDPAAAASSSGSSTRDWVARPVFICSIDFVLWLEGINRVDAAANDTEHDAIHGVDSSAAHDRLTLANRFNHTITWADVCIWNSLSKFEHLRAAHQTKAFAERKAMEAMAAGVGVQPSSAMAAGPMSARHTSLTPSSGTRHLHPPVASGRLVPIISVSTGDSSVEVLNTRRVIPIESI